MIKNLFSISIISLFLAKSLTAQVSSDALRYTQQRAFSTARSSAIGGAIGGIGADFTNSSINPAGLGLFRSSDLSISLLTQSTDTKSRVEGNSANNSTNQNTIDFNLSGIGLVIAHKPIGSNWKQVNVSIGMTGTGSFDENVFFSGKSPGSILHRYYELSLDPAYPDGRGYDPDNLDDFEAGLAYETGALFDISPDSGLYRYTTDLKDIKNLQTLKRESYRQRGFARNLSFGIGSNFREYLMLGGSIEVPLGKYQMDRTYREINDQGAALQPFDKLVFTENITTEYSGVVAKLGIMARPIHQLRIGLSWHSPGYHWMSDRFNTEMTYSYLENNKLNTYSAASPDGYFNYRLITPMRWIGSLAWVGSRGFISLDVDVYDPSDASFDLTSESNNDADREYQILLNSEIEKQYKTTFEYRLGAEYAIDLLRLRAGYQLISSPYQNSNEYGGGFSLGAGLRFRRVFLDAGLSQLRHNFGYVPFATGNSDFDGDGVADAVSTLVTQNQTRWNFQLTLGFKF